METIILEEKYILEYIKSIINDLKDTPYYIKDDTYHHNTNYESASSIIKHGILTMNDLHKLNIINFTEESLIRTSDTTSHINGNDKISLSMANLTDLYPDELEFISASPISVDFLVSRTVHAYRNAAHYGNEFLATRSIPNDKLLSVDTRLLNLISILETNQTVFICPIENLINDFNCLKDIALSLKQSKLNIPLREMSDNKQYTMNLDKLSKNPRLVLKK